MTARGLITELLDEMACQRPNARAVTDGTGCDTYASLAEQARFASVWLADRGVRHGERVVLRLPGDRTFVALLYGALRLGAVVVPIHPTTGSFHLRWILRDAAPALVVTTEEDLDNCRGLEGAQVHPSAAWAHSTPPATAALRVETPTAVAPTDLALLMYTSGSTAMPRAVICPHERVRFAVSAIAMKLRYTAEDVVLCRVPLSFDYGLYQLFLAASAGAQVVLRPDLPEPAALGVAREVGATVLPVTPTLATILTRLASRSPGPGSVRLLTNTGAALSAPLAGRLRAAFPKAAVATMYGLTECKRAAIAEYDEDVRHPGTVGRALPGTELLVVDESGASVAPGVVGEIWARGPHVMAGYWRNDEATRECFSEPGSAWPTLRTGDYGYVDEDSRLYVLGRRDDVFKRSCVRMSVQDVEAALLDVPGVAAAAVLPPDADGQLVAWVVSESPAREVLDLMAQRVDRIRVPDRCMVVPELPATANGKVDRAALRAGLSEWHQ